MDELSEVSYTFDWDENTILGVGVVSSFDCVQAGADDESVFDGRKGCYLYTVNKHNWHDSNILAYFASVYEAIRFAEMLKRKGFEKDKPTDNPITYNEFVNQNSLYIAGS